MRSMIPQFEDSLMSTRKPFMALCASLVIVASANAAAPAATTVDPALAAVVASPARTASFVARDAARHPAEELSYFGLKPNMTVVELWPSSGYWTEILGPYLAKDGHYYVAQPVPGNKEEDESVARWRSRVAGMKGARRHHHGNHAWQGSLRVRASRQRRSRRDVPQPSQLGRRRHYGPEVLKGCFNALKPGGILGIEDHRGRNDKPQDPKAADGYLRQDYTIELARKAGFEYVGASEINANPKDTKDWVDGVWTLPPTLSQGDKDRARYVAIGEADNYVLKFRKPKK
jgi:predicted methyltransferase